MKNYLRGLAFAGGVLLSLNVAIAGDYDGVWTLSTGTEADQDYFILYQNGSTLLLVNNYGELDGWEAWTGQFSTPDSVTVSTIISDDGTATVVSINFTSLTTATITLDSCNPASACDIPIGVPIPANKIF